MIDLLYEQYLTEKEKEQIPYSLFLSKIKELKKTNLDLSEENLVLNAISILKKESYLSILLNQLPKNEGSFIRVKAKIINIGEIQEIISKDNKELSLKKLLIFDGIKLAQLTLWGNTCFEIDETSLFKTFDFIGKSQLVNSRNIKYHTIKVSQISESDSDLKINLINIADINFLEENSLINLRVKLVNYKKLSYSGDNGDKNYYKLLVEDLSGVEIVTIWSNNLELELDKEYFILCLLVKNNNLSLNKEKGILSIEKLNQESQIYASISKVNNHKIDDLNEKIGNLYLTFKAKSLVKYNENTLEVYNFVDSNNQFVNLIPRKVDLGLLKPDCTYLFKNVKSKKTKEGYFNIYDNMFTEFIEYE